MSRLDEYSTTVRVDGLGNLGVFDKLVGGEVDSTETKYNPGGMAKPVSLGGAQIFGNVTVSRLYRLDRDHPIIHTLYNLAGKGGITITKQPLDVDGNAYGRPITINGTIKLVKAPEHDSTSSNPGILDIEVVPTAIG